LRSARRTRPGPAEPGRPGGAGAGDGAGRAAACPAGSFPGCPAACPVSSAAPVPGSGPPESGEPVSNVPAVAAAGWPGRSGSARPISSPRPACHQGRCPCSGSRSSGRETCPGTPALPPVAEAPRRSHASRMEVLHPAIRDSRSLRAPRALRSVMKLPTIAVSDVQGAGPAIMPGTLKMRNPHRKR